MQKPRGNTRAGPASPAQARLPWLLALLLLILPAPQGRAQTSPAREYQVKAVFLFNFAHFVEWPPATFSDPKAPLVIGILGDDPFGPYLDEAVRGETVNDRPLVVRHYSRAEEAAGSHILFIARSESGHLDDILSTLKSRSILTVCDTDGDARSGVIIRLLDKRSRIRLKINLEAAQAAGLTLSSKLLRPAEIVTPGKD